MTKPQYICVSLEWAKRLQSAGMKNKSPHFWWVKWDGDDSYIIETQERMQFVEIPRDANEVIAAPTAGELMNELPEGIEYRGQKCWLEIRKCYAGFEVAYRNRSVGTFTTMKKFSDALSSMYCYLAEHNLLPQNS